VLDRYGFDEWAGHYDDSIDTDKFPFIRYYEVLSNVVALVDPKPEMKVMDIGIGTGILSEKLYEHGCMIHGVDFSAKMIEKARQRIPGGLFEIVDVKQDHFGKLNDVYYDRIVSSYFFHHLDIDEKVSLIIKALRDNLESNGIMIIADVGFESENDLDDGKIKYRELWDDDEFYLCGNSIIARLESENVKAEYEQISPCAGILVCRNF